MNTYQKLMTFQKQTNSQKRGSLMLVSKAKSLPETVEQFLKSPRFLQPLQKQSYQFVSKFVRTQ